MTHAKQKQIGKLCLNRSLSWMAWQLLCIRSDLAQETPDLLTQMIV